MRGSIPGSGCPQPGHEHPLLSSRLEESLDRLLIPYGKITNRITSPANAAIRKFNFFRRYSRRACKKKSRQRLFCSTQQPVPRVAVSPWCLPVPVWRISVPRHSLSAMGPRAPATTLPINTASGSPPWTPARSLSIPLCRRP